MVFGGVDRKFQFPGAVEQGFLELPEAERYATQKRFLPLQLLRHSFSKIQECRFSYDICMAGQNSKARPLAMPEAELFG